MKKALSVILSLALVIAIIPFTTVETSAGVTHTVTFKNKATAEVYEEQTVEDGACAVRPTDPTMVNYTFMGWCYGSNLDEFDFSTPVTADMTIYATWTEGTWVDVPYIDENGNSAVCTQKPYITITDTTSFSMNYQNRWNKGWYVVEGNVTLDYLSSGDTVNLILKDGATLTVSGRLTVGGTLNVYAQSAGTGAIVCPRTSDTSQSPTIGISQGNTLIVNGGNISATGLNYVAAIGGNFQNTAGTLIINAGTVTATGGNYAAAIGASYNGNGGNIIINGGSVTATGGEYGCSLGGYHNGTCSVTINGGQVTATADTGSAGIKATSLSLGWTDASDFVNIGNSVVASSVTFNDNFVFDSDNTLLVTTDNLGPAKIVPYTGAVYTVRFLDSDGVTELASPLQFAAGGTLASLPTVNKYGYRFIEWRNGPAAFTVPAVINQSVDLIAYYEQIAAVSYVDENGVLQTCNDYVEIHDVSTDGATYEAGWYVFTGDSTFTDRLVLNGAVNLILTDGATLTAQKGITVGKTGTLTVYGQTNQTGAITTGTPDQYYAGIGGVQNGSSGAIVINGGVITATGGRYAAGIGGGAYSGCASLVINNGTVNATGGQYAAGIGGGAYSGNTNTIVTINGGTVTATGGSSGSGIGHGINSSKTGTVTINGGTVTATGGNSAAAIGGGQSTDGGTIAINGGNVRALATQTSSRGIGAGNGKQTATVTLDWSETTDSIYAASYNISDISFFNAFHVENMSTVVNTVDEIENQTIVPFTGTCYTVNFFDSDGVTKLNKTLFCEAGGTVTPPEIPVKSGYRFAAWMNNGNPFDFTTSVNGNLQLLASWTVSTPVNYVDENGVAQTCSEYTFIESTAKEITLSSGWYVVDGDITVSGRITVSGTVHLIITDGADASVPGDSLTASKGITVNRGNALHIYGQSLGTGSLTTGTPDGYYAGIGGGYSNGGGTIVINGTNVSARGGNQAPGIGSGYVGGSGVTCDGAVIINGGTVTARGGSNGAGIGAGQIYYSTNNTTVTINGGTVSAIGGNQGAGIGGGYNTPGGTIHINGGTVTAQGGNSGCGIGGLDQAVITLSWTDANHDSIRATSYSAQSITFAKNFLNELGEIANEHNISNTTLTPYTGTVYSVSFYDDDGVTPLYEPIFATYGQVLQAPSAPRKDGFKFVAWLESTSGLAFDFSTAIQNDVTLIASFRTADPVSYIDENGEPQSRASYLPLSSELAEVTWTDGWYVVDEDVTFAGRITVSGTVHLILCDGYTLTASKGISVTENNTLNIYGQSLQTGALTTGTPNEYYAGIGGYREGSQTRHTGDIVINGGTVTATGGRYAAGIGGGLSGYYGSIVINGGTVNAYGGQGSAGIGGGYTGMPDSITINGGTVTATGGNDTPAIGSGRYNTTRGGSIAINGGHVTANGNGSDSIGIGKPTVSATAVVTITLSWTQTTDRIYASSYNGDSITLLKTFYTDNPYEPATVSNIGGKTLIPFVSQYDVNQDGAENSGDYDYLVSAALGDVAVTTALLAKADLYPDGVIDALDCRLLKLALQGKSLPV